MATSYRQDAFKMATLFMSGKVNCVSTGNQEMLVFIDLEGNMLLTDLYNT